MKFLIIILLFIFALFIIVPSIIAGILRFLLSMLGGGSSRRYGAGSSQQRHRTDEGYTTSFNRTETTDGSRKKVFDKNEGEYVSFEEIDKPSDGDKK
jgi:hypothetical protein